MLCVVCVCCVCACVVCVNMRVCRPVCVEVVSSLVLIRLDTADVVRSTLHELVH